MNARTRCSPDVHILNSIFNRGLSWSDMLGELIDNSFGDAAGNAQNVEIVFKDGKVVVMDDGEGISNLDAITTLGDSASQHSGSDIGRYGVGAKDAMFGIGSLIRIETIYDGRYHTFEVDALAALDEGEWWYSYNGQGTESKAAIRRMNGWRTRITIDRLHESKRRPKTGSLIESLQHTYRPAIREGRSIVVETDGKRRNVTEYHEGLQLSDEIKGESWIKDKNGNELTFEFHAGLTQVHSPKLCKVWYGYGYRMITSSTELRGTKLPSQAYVEVLLGPEWKEHLSANKNTIAAYGEMLEVALNTEVSELIYTMRQITEEARLEKINADLAKSMMKALTYCEKEAGKAQANGDVDILGIEGHGGVLPQPEPDDRVGDPVEVPLLPAKLAVDGGDRAAKEKKRKLPGVRFRLNDDLGPAAYDVSEEGKGVLVLLSKADMAAFRFSKTVDSSDCLYIWQLDQIDFLPTDGDFSGNWGWPISGRVIAFTARPFELGLRFYNDQKQVVQQSVSIERTQCNYGGSRPWFRCSLCSRRVAMLIAGDFFLCRHCQGLRYRSQQERAPERARHKVQKIQKRLGNPDWQNTLYPNFPIPKGMWQRAHDRLVSEAEESLQVIYGSLVKLPDDSRGQLGTKDFIRASQLRSHRGAGWSENSSKALVIEQANAESSSL